MQMLEIEKENAINILQVWALFVERESELTF